MMMSKKIVGVSVDGETQWHAVNIGPTDHHTMCGIDADDPAIGHAGTVTAPRGQKIDCEQCLTMWRGFRSLGLRASDFA